MTHLEKLAKKYECENFFELIIEKQLLGYPEWVRKYASELTRQELVLFCAYALSDEYGSEAAHKAVMTLTTK